MASKQGREWEITIIGARDESALLESEGKKYVVSDNGRLYDVDALAASAPMWDGVKVYDNHLTQQEFEERQGLRSPLNEWVGVIKKPYWDAKANKLKAQLKIVEDRLMGKLKNAWDAGVLGAIGLSIDTITRTGREIFHEGRRLPVVSGFEQILSVDIVGQPAAGGGFERLIAAKLEKKENNMTEETKESPQYVTLDLFEEKLAAVMEALEALSAERDIAVEELSDDEVKEALDKQKLSKAERDKVKAEIELKKLEDKATEARLETDKARTELMVERMLDKSKLPEKFADGVRSQFKDSIASKSEVEAAINHWREAYASLDPTGRVKAGAADVSVGLMDDERFELEFQRLMMGNTAFKNLEKNTDEGVGERIKEAKAYKSWVNAGKPELPHYRSIGNLLYDYFGGDPLLNTRAMEAATTSSLSTVVKNTVNIMAANAYSMRERWFEPIVSVEEVDTIDQATLARVYGVNTLSVVSEGAAYTELVLADEEETASFVKKGNFIGITLETLMRDKINYVRRIPVVLADAWYNTLSSLVSGVFTVNSAAGPVLADSGALFNATAVGTPGGHANLLTTGLSHSEFGVVRTAMRKQTDQPLGAGRKLLLQPKYILVPVDIETTALEIRNSELVPAQSGGATSGGAFQSQNLYRGQFEVIVVPDWTDADNWAAVADPMIAPAIWLIYPRGQRTPQIFSADSEGSGAMFTNDELRFKVRMMTYRFSATYDCAPVSDFRPLHKSNV